MCNRTTLLLSFNIYKDIPFYLTLRERLNPFSNLNYQLLGLAIHSRYVNTPEITTNLPFIQR